jgi:succinate-semialdehyde dehydrogenase/glutarate-semialdehyde dehydrogenase
MLYACKLGAALAAGCSVLLKPAEETPAAVAAVVGALAEAGLPEGAVQLVLGDPAQISSTLIAAAPIRKITFTGSTGVGRLLGSLAGQHLKRVTLELGGHAPVVIFEDADFDQTVALLAGFKFRNAGQICANPSRFYVQRPIYERFVEAFAAAAARIRLGDGIDPATEMGPLASGRRLEAVSALVADALAHGARLACGGKALLRSGHFFQPTVLADVPDDAGVMNEEPFGPIVPIAPFDTLDEVIERANRLPVGLAAYGFSSSARTMRRLSEELEAGAVGINSVMLLQPETPFGGIRDSGYGKENGIEGLQDYLSAKFLSIGM